MAAMHFAVQQSFSLGFEVFQHFLKHITFFQHSQGQQKLKKPEKWPGRKIVLSVCGILLVCLDGLGWIGWGHPVDAILEVSAPGFLHQELGS